MGNTCCVFGHRKLYLEIESELYTIIKRLINGYGVEIFLTGGMGETDERFSSVVRSLKRIYPNIKLILVIPYFSNVLNSNKEYYDIMYDDILLPDELIGSYYKAAITKRNKWMIENSDYIIDCTYRNFGGAYDAVAYRKSLGEIIVKVKNNTHSPKENGHKFCVELQVLKKLKITIRQY